MRGGALQQQRQQQVMLVFFRYRILVQNEFLGVNEEKFLKTIELEEQLGENTYQSETAKEKAKKEKDKSVNKAAIGFVYEDSTGPKKKPQKEESEEEEEEEEDDDDIDLNVDVMSLGPDQQDDINKIGKDYECGPRHFVRALAREEEEKEELRMAKEKAQNKPSGKDDLGRRRKLNLHKIRVLSRRDLRRPSYAVRTGSKSPDSR